MEFRPAFAALAAAFAPLLISGSARAADGDLAHLIPAFSAQAPGTVQKPWVVQGLLGKPDKPVTDIRVEYVDGKRALALRTQASYGAASFVWPQGTPAPARLSWSWRLDEALAHSDLRTKEGDDAALKLCLLFDLPIEKLKWVDRATMQMLRARFNQPIPSATICYVWDSQLAVGTTLPNAFSSRMRYIVVDTGPATQRWMPHTVDVKADFMRLFGSEVSTLPPLIAVAVGADADNTQGRSLGFVSDLSASK
jgi:hypothetical protein